MKGKKDGIIWSVRLIIFSAVIFFVLQFHLYTDSFKNLMRLILPFGLSDWRDFFMVIMSGIFTSSFVTLIMNCSDYKNEKRDAMENYFLVSYRFLNNFKDIKYLYIREDLDLIRNYYLERNSNEIRKIRGTDNQNFKAKLALQEWIWKNESKEDRKRYKKIKQKYLSVRVESIISDYDKELDQIIKQYIKLSELSYQEIEDSYRNIDFLCTNKLNRNEFILKFIHEKQKNMLKKIKSESYHFKYYNDKPNTVMLDKILELQNEIFIVEDKKYEKSIYNQYCYEVTCNLEFLLQLHIKRSIRKTILNKEIF